MLLAIETSCDETAACLLDYRQFIDNPEGVGSALLAEEVSSQIKLHAEYGGVVPELAAREHLKNLPVVVNSVLEKTKLDVEDLSVVCCTQGPGLKGCLLVGFCYGKGLAYGLGVPFLPLNHLEGHLFSVQLDSNYRSTLYPALTLLVSGGHTLLVLAKAFREYQIIAETRDDAAGEAFDKTASLLKLAYPGGPAISLAAEEGNSSAFNFPRAMPKDSGSFSFSGLKTAVSRQVAGLAGSLTKADIADVAASAQSAIVGALVDKAEIAIKNFKIKEFNLVGGVACNALLRAELEELCGQHKLRLNVPKPKWCTDNAAMMAVLGARVIESRFSEFSAWQAGSNFLGPNASFDIGVKPRFPINEIVG